jgi:predicted nucleic acid-binding protein
VTIVIDASVAVKWVLREPDSDAADALLDYPDLIAPVIWLAEAANALWRRARIGEITSDEASMRLSELRNAPVASVAIEPHLDEALRLAMESRHPVYDCVYVVLALNHRTQLLTADRRLASAMTSSFELAGTVRLLGN